MFKSISQKLPLVITLLVTLLLLGSMIFMSYSFETFYRKAKITSLTENMDQFKNQANAPEKTFIQAINDFETDNNTRLFIFGENGDYIEIINNFFSHLVKEQSFQKKLLLNKEIITRDYERKDGSVQYFLTASAIERDGGTGESLAISISSMLPINEASRTIKNVFSYVFMGGFLVIILLATLISNTITKPLRKLTQSSKELANLNFNVAIDLNQKDEIGDLGKSLSILSKNLSQALMELEKKNLLLSEDLKKRKDMEDQRKTFIRDISHELKTPITLIQGYTEGLIDGINENNQAEYLSIILDETKNMETLVKDMIELSYTESDAFILSLEAFNLSQTILDCAAPFLDYQQKGIRFSFRVDSHVTLFGDQIKLATAFRNIIKNAVIHTEKEGEIQIDLTELADEIRLNVKNSPACIEGEELEKIWVEFYKKDQARTRTPGSSGLGLSIVKNILDLHGYTYRLFNDGVGVSFSISFPKAQEIKPK